MTPLIDGEPMPMTMIEALVQRRFAVAMKGEKQNVKVEICQQA